jgi:hypothetical protein
LADISSVGCISVVGRLTRLDNSALPGIDVVGSIPIGTPPNVILNRQGATTDAQGRFALTWTLIIPVREVGDTITVRLLANDSRVTTGPFDSIRVTRVVLAPRAPIPTDTLAWKSGSAP